MEIELQILDPQTLNLCPQGPVILKEAPEELRPFLKPEAYQSMIELVTPICRNVKEVEDFLREYIRRLEKIAAKNKALIFAASLHPFAQAKEQKIWEKKRYQRIFEELQLVGRRFIAQGLHIHLGMPSGESALKVYRGLRPYLPLLLALSTSSPFYEGHPTGFHSYRSKLFEVLPLAGLPRDFSTWQELEGLISKLKDLGIITDVCDLWWDLRIQPALGTVEIRIYDVPGRLKEITALVALTQALGHYLLTGPAPTKPPEQELILYGKWQAARYGVKGRFIDPLSGQCISFTQGLRRLLEWLKESTKALGLTHYLQELSPLLTQGPSSTKIYMQHQKGRDLKTIVRDLKAQFWS